VPKFTAGTTIGNSSIVDSASAVAMTINPSGNVGIGTTSPAYKLQVNGETYIRATAGYNLLFQQSGTTLRQNFINDAGSANISSSLRGTDYEFQKGDGVPVFNISSTGNVGIGYTAPATKLSVNGTALINTNTDNGVDKLQVSGSAIASTLKVNTSGQTTSISNYYNGGIGNNIWIGGGGLSGTSASAYNISLGANALLSNTSGEFNAGVGAEALQNNTTGFRNMAFGS
jgi:hypothetical protein